MALSAWGTANMRTGGDDIAQALALMGCRPVWDGDSRRVTGVEVLPLGVLGRPRVDVTLRVSGFFRDAFPAQIELLDDACRAVAGWTSRRRQPAGGAARSERGQLEAGGMAPAEAGGGAAARMFGSKPGAYGAGLQALIDERGWRDEGDLAAAWLAWGGYAYGRGTTAAPREGELARRLTGVELVLHNQDNREHDLLDSDDYYQFEGGLAATVRHLSGRQPGDLPQRPFAPGIPARPHAEGGDRPGRARPGRQPEMAARASCGTATRARSRSRPRSTICSRSPPPRAWSRTIISTCCSTPISATTRCAASSPSTIPRPCARSPQRFEEAIARGLWRPRRNSAPALLDELGAG